MNISVPHTKEKERKKRKERILQLAESAPQDPFSDIKKKKGSQ
jgi:hypothetical protein